MNQQLTSNTERILLDIYFQTHKEPRWLFDAEELYYLNADEVRFLEVSDVWFSRFQKDADHDFREAKTEYELGLTECETEDEAIKKLSKDIADVYLRYKESYERDEPLQSRVIMLEFSGVKKMESARNRYVARMRHTGKGDVWDSLIDSKNDLQDYEITYAREFPLEKLVEPNRNGMVLCPFHDDVTPNLYVKKGFGYCFACGEWTDSIKWMMKTQAKNFLNTVRAINRLS